MLFKQKYENLKDEKEKLESDYKKKLKDNQTLMTSQEEKYKILYKKLEIFQVDIAAFKDKISLPKEAN